MNLTPGEMFFYGGIIGMAITFVVAIIVIVILSGSRRRLRRKLDEEYGGSIK